MSTLTPIVASAAAALLLACVACPFAPAEPTEATSDAAAPPMGTTLWHELFAGLARHRHRALKYLQDRRWFYGQLSDPTAQ